VPTEPIQAEPVNTEPQQAEPSEDEGRCLDIPMGVPKHERTKRQARHKAVNISIGMMS